ncbi:hypothetical protein [Nocardioides cynanchi]|uniref:hypothetical protein n=1 Tax=Nocardioides cynanchi TaxID=2558918 RepID=UPI001243EE9A|nr:hypothetical protein [Nocardioides cynanchi]
MATIDLSHPPPTAAGLLDALPRRLALTLPELQLAASHAGGAPLPFEVTDPAPAGAFDQRLGTSRASAQDQAYAAALAALHDPAETLARRGLLTHDSLDQGLAGALGLLATPRVAVDLDVTVDGARVRAWHREAQGAVATLATADGLVFELAWLAASAWPDELARAAMLPSDQGLRGTALPDAIDVPFELLDAASEAVRSSRSDLLPVLAARHSGACVDADGGTIGDVELASMLSALIIDTRGRLRALGADVSGDETTVVGVVSWVLLADGWHALRPRRDGDEHRVEVRRVEAADLAGDLAFVLAEVVGR